MKILLRTVLLVLFGALSLSAQDQDEGSPKKADVQAKVPPVDPKSLARVSGIVTVAGTGAPLKKVGVALTPQSRIEYQPGQLSAVTDAAGRFHLDSIPPGKYWLLVKRQGFYRSDPNVRGALMNRSALVLAPGEKNDKLAITMSTGGLITGRLTDADGEALRWAAVKALKLSRTGARKTYKVVRAGTSNDIGEYRLYDLPPGNYIVAAEPGRRGDEDTLPWEEEFFSQGRDPSERYAPTYYPGSTDSFLAQQIKVETGSEARADMTLSPVHAVKVTGSVNKPRALMASVMLVPKDFDFTVNESEIAQGAIADDGKFTVENVSPGQYNVMAWGMLDRKPYYDRSELSVGADDIKGVQLEMKPMLELQGRVTVEGVEGPPPDLSRLRLLLISVDNAFQVGSGFSQISKDGTMKISNLLPGKYQVQLELSGMKKNAVEIYLKSLRFGGRDVLGSELNLTPGDSSSTLDAVLSTRVAYFEGGAVDDDGKPVPSATVILVPKGPAAKAVSRFYKTVSDQNGHFVLAGLAPGDYTLYAWEQDPSPGRFEGDPSWLRAFMDEEFMRALEGKGTPLKVREGLSDSGKIKVIKPEPED